MLFKTILGSPDVHCICKEKRNISRKQIESILDILKAKRSIECKT